VSDRETLPPSAPDAEASEFEAAISERGESSARWDRLMALLAPQDPANHDAVHVAVRAVCR
jgi:hypothetical protein